MAKSTSGRKWAMDIGKTLKKRRDGLDTLVRLTAVDMFSTVVDMSPVREGRFINSWAVGINSQPTGGEASADPDVVHPPKPVVIERVTGECAPVKAGDTIYLTNNLPYAERLENEGWSDQAPDGMVGVTVRLFGGIVDGAAEKAFKD